jgi:hypothetical protein
MGRKLFKVGDIVEYRHGGQLEVIFVDPKCTYGLPYQCCLPGEDPMKNAWFAHSDLLEPKQS